MIAFIPAAGLGSRLQPFTLYHPKALAQVDGEPLLKIAINRLVTAGASRIVVNVHHLANQVEEYLQSYSWPVKVLVSDERDCLMDTGGGLKHAEFLLTELPNTPILLHNVDVLSRINLQAMLRHHYQKGYLATLAVSNRHSSRELLFNNLNNLCGWRNRTSGEELWSYYHEDNCKGLSYSGIAILNPQLLQMLPPATHPYPLIPELIKIAQTHKIGYYLHDCQDWMDVGTPQRLEQAQTFLMEK